MGTAELGSELDDVVVVDVDGGGGGVVTEVELEPVFELLVTAVVTVSVPEALAVSANLAPTAPG